MGTPVFVAAGCVVLAASFGATRFGFDVAQATQSSTVAQAGTQAPQPSAQDMMKMREQMMADMNAGNAKLDALVKDMNAASGEARVSALVAVVNELVQQRRAMHHHMEQMHHHMMGGRGIMMHQTLVDGAGRGTRWYVRLD